MKIKMLIFGLIIVGIFLLSACSENIIDNQTEETPRICTADWNPVCGVDGKTYANECNAGDNAIAYTGECGQDNAFSEPKACTREYMPVCGADGVTYPNECTAGEISWTQGECPKQLKKIVQN